MRNLRGCRRVSLLGYFGERWTERNCGSCDNCLDQREEVDVTIECQKLLSCIFRINRIGPAMGLNHTVEVLRGSENAKVLAKGHNTLSTHGIGKDQPAEYWQALGQAAYAGRIFGVSDDGYGTLDLTDQALKALKEERVRFG